MKKVEAKTEPLQEIKFEGGLSIYKKMREFISTATTHDDCIMIKDQT